MSKRPFNRKKKEKSISRKEFKEFCLDHNRKQYYIDQGTKTLEDDGDLKINQRNRPVLANFKTPRVTKLPPLKKDSLTLQFPRKKTRYNDILKEAMNLELKHNPVAMPILKPKHILKELGTTETCSMSPSLKGVRCSADYSSKKHVSNLTNTVSISINNNGGDKRTSNQSITEARSNDYRTMSCSNVNWS